jgi:phosphoribosylanthranilate isomerase
MTVAVKICGLTTPEAVAAAEDANFAGFIFYPPSPRNVTPAQAAKLIEVCHSRESGNPGHDPRLRGGEKRLLRPAIVAVTVNADDALLSEIKAILKPAWFQLHGSESPKRVREVKEKFGISVIKAVPMASGDDAAKAHAFEDVADMLLFDARPPKGLPGGNGIAFDWRLLAHRSFARPWFLSGGLTIDNIEEALHISGAKRVDVSSSLESSPGIKDAALVREFVKKVKSIPI